VAFLSAARSKYDEAISSAETICTEEKTEHNTERNITKIEFAMHAAYSIIR
jgi:hypothetical protein